MTTDQRRMSDNEYNRRRTVFAILKHQFHTCEIFHVNEGRKMYATMDEPIIRMVDMPINGGEIPPLVKVSIDIAQEIVDALFIAGIHPTQYRETYKQMDEMQRTLDGINEKLAGGFVMKIRAKGEAE